MRPGNSLQLQAFTHALKDLQESCPRSANIYLIANQRFSPNQHGNTKECISTNTSILQRPMPPLKLEIKNRQLTATVLLDMSKAFDSRPRNPFCPRFRILDCHLSLPNGFVAISSYSQYQAVKIHDTISGQLPMTCGVPRESILGPLLFSIYTKDRAIIFEREKNN